MHLVFTRICQVRVTVGESGLCCTCVAYFELSSIPLRVDCTRAAVWASFYFRSLELPYVCFGDKWTKFRSFKSQLRYPPNLHNVLLHNNNCRIQSLETSCNVYSDVQSLLMSDLLIIVSAKLLQQALCLSRLLRVFFFFVCVCVCVCVFFSRPRPYQAVFCQTRRTQSCGKIELWECGTIGAWSRGTIELWEHRAGRKWNCGNMEMWEHGTVGISQLVGALSPKNHKGLYQG